MAGDQPGICGDIAATANDDPVVTGKITLAHLNEFLNYYDRLEKMEKEADKFWGKD